MTLVLDANVAVAIGMDRSKIGSLAEAVGAADLVIAPDLFVVEVLNALWKYHAFENLSPSACDAAIKDALELVDILISSMNLRNEAFLLARTLRKPVYDMFYLAAARAENGTLLTLDSALKKEAERLSIPVIG